MTSATNMAARLSMLQRQLYAYSQDEVARIEQLALLDCILEELRQLNICIARIKEAKE